MKSIFSLLIKIIVICNIILFMQENIHSEPTINLFLEPYPQIKMEKLKKPNYLSKQRINGLLQQAVAGIMATYAGFFQVSSFTGQLQFPRKHSAPLLHVVITPALIPIPMFGLTIHHWELEPRLPAALYRYERMNEDTIGPFWKVTKLSVPETGEIPLDALVIIAKPKHVFIPEGISLTKESPNLILPPLYIKKGINIIKNALYMLHILHFFSPVSYQYKKEKDRSMKLITE